MSGVNEYVAAGARNKVLLWGVRQQAVIKYVFVQRKRKRKIRREAAIEYVLVCI